jgi:DNA replication protein DnaC
MTIDLSDVQFDVLLKRLHLANTRRAWRELVHRAERDEWSYRDFLALLVSEEIAHRQQTRIARMVRRAHFPFFKTIDDFNFTYQSTVRLALLGSALAADFVTEGRCLIFGGKPGRGKTHLAVAIAYRAIQHGFDALFVTAAELIDDLSGAFRRGQLADALARYVHPAVIVIDEVGYLTYGTDAANMLFHVVNDRHRKKRAMIFTTNKPLTAWGRVLHDEDLAHAILDRILERGRMLTLDGPSMRTRHLGVDDATSPEASAPPARISGIDRPEFPEPTAAEATILGAEVTLAATQGRGRDAESGGGAIDDAPGASTDHFAARDPIVGRQSEPRGEMVLVRPARHVESDFADDGLRDADIDAVDAGQIDAADALQLARQVELRRVTARLPAAFGVRLTMRGGCTVVLHFVGQVTEMLLQGMVAFGDPLQIAIVGRHFLLKDE